LIDLQSKLWEEIYILNKKKETVKTIENTSIFLKISRPPAIVVRPPMRALKPWLPTCDTKVGTALADHLGAPRRLLHQSPAIIAPLKSILLNQLHLLRMILATITRMGIQEADWAILLAAFVAIEGICHVLLEVIVVTIGLLTDDDLVDVDLHIPLHLEKSELLPHL
jgi:hypothetical protein